MKHIKRLRLFENSQDLNQEQIDFLDLYASVRWSVNPITGLVDVKGDFNCGSENIQDFKGINFGEISGDFRCNHNRITSLEGSPNKVYGNFNCEDNSLTSLKGSPEEVIGYFACNGNLITSLEGSPKEVGGDFWCNYNSLTSLEGAPQNIKRSFVCYSNRLTSLKGAPQKVEKIFWCSRNPLKSLEGAPLIIGGEFVFDSLELRDGKWGFPGWSQVLINGSLEAKSLILTLPQFDPTRLIQDEIDKNPGKWVMILKDIWNLPSFRPKRDRLRVSDQFLKDIGDQSGLSDLGF